MLGNFYRAEAESYARLGDTETAEKKFKDLIDRYPNFAWGYIGWADNYWLDPFDEAAPKDYANHLWISNVILAEAVSEHASLLMLPSRSALKGT